MARPGGVLIAVAAALLAGCFLRDQLYPNPCPCGRFHIDGRSIDYDSEARAYAVERAALSCRFFRMSAVRLHYVSCRIEAQDVELEAVQGDQILRVRAARATIEPDGSARFSEDVSGLPEAGAAREGPVLRLCPAGAGPGPSELQEDGGGG